jgi:hypothetical protein
MSNTLLRHIIRAVILILIQVLVLKRIGLGTSWIAQNGDIFIYPLIIFMLPFKLFRHYVILIGFCVGLTIDMFYNTIGVHAFALTATAYARGILLSYLEPRGGYQLSMNPTMRSLGLNWVFTFTALSLVIHSFLFFTAEIFTFVYIGKILFKTVLTTMLSLAITMGYHFLFNPRS